MKQTQPDLVHIVAKYWLESAIGLIAVLVLVVGIIVSQGGSRGSGDTGSSSAPDIAASSYAVLPGRPLMALDIVMFDNQKQELHYQENMRLTIKQGESLRLIGWAVDQFAKTSPAAVFVQVDEFARAQGSMGDRPDVAQFLKTPAYERSAFSVVIPPALLSPGDHRLALLVENAAKTGYHVDAHWLQVEVLPQVARLLQGTTYYSLDAILVGASSPLAATAQPAEVTTHSNEPVRLGGWAADRASGLAAGGVSAVLDGTKVFKGSVGGPKTRRRSVPPQRFAGFKWLLSHNPDCGPRPRQA